MDRRSLGVADCGETGKPPFWLAGTVPVQHRRLALRKKLTRILALNAVLFPLALGLGELNPYGFSKACASLYTLWLARQHPGLLINACTPGYIETDLTRPAAQGRGLSPADLGMKPPEQGTVAILFLLFGEPRGSGNYYGSDARRSPLDRYRAPGSPEYRWSVSVRCSSSRTNTSTRWPTWRSAVRSTASHRSPRRAAAVTLASSVLPKLPRTRTRPPDQE